MIENLTNETLVSRRNILASASSTLGGAALASLMNPASAVAAPARAGLPHFAPRAKRVIYLFQSGGPPQHDMFDYKPHLETVHGEETPESVFGDQRLTGMSSGQASFPVAKSIFKFAQHGESGTWVSEVMPHTAKIVDDICVMKSVHTDAINHDPAITFLQTGFQIAGRPSIGAWMSYGLGSENENLPAFVAMMSGNGGQPLYDRLWGSGFLPSEHQGVRFRSGKDPVLYLNNPPGFSAKLRRATLDHLSRLNQLRADEVGDPEIAARVAQYEMAFRMQTSVPDLTDVSDEPNSTFELYGEDARKPGTYAHNALIARRLSERGVRFVQLFHRGWDTHGGLPKQLRARCKETDQATAALVTDLRNRGMLDDTLVVWGGEFGRTVYCQGDLKAANYGRDHHPRCFTMWMAGGGIKPGISYGSTDDYGYNVVDGPLSVHDLHATILNQLGVNHERLTFKFQGRHYRLTDVHGEVVKELLS
ncbi:DUF1501 domain-containing protein [Rubripirellula reticaptiva]|uniref:Sulfatase n=1 Tax=Rubripirellula reticaptiva TaxID=2528013 RepID=A0A5C6F3A5_9BACT|nr:DUF1501 domain-containing protein [Rubripirellula reticaptiva]TWU55612.1 hypothetical protein Poly59_19120 [Rubripirellula reticaptiva]